MQQSPEVQVELVVLLEQPEHQEYRVLQVRQEFPVQVVQVVHLVIQLDHVTLLL
jgi:hypothetical protein